MNEKKRHIQVVDQLVQNLETAVVHFDLDGRRVGKIEVKDGVVTHASVIHIFGERALHILRRLPARMMVEVQRASELALRPKSLVSDAWDRTAIHA